jgi:hypothetical protein
MRTYPEPAGLTTVSRVDEFTTMWLPTFWPKVTVVARVKFVPVTVTELPPTVEPLVGLKLVTVGGAVGGGVVDPATRSMVLAAGTPALA